MTITDAMTARGSVEPSFVNMKTGERLPWPDRHNTLSFDASKAMAMAFGGDSSMIPDSIGIIYGSNEWSPSAITRDQTWEALEKELAVDVADIQIQQFSYSPSLKDVKVTDKDGTVKTGTAVVFHAHTNSSTPGKLGTSLNSISAEKTYILQAVLLRKLPGDKDSYYVLARVDLKNEHGYQQKPADFEVALDWTVKFF